MNAGCARERLSARESWLPRDVARVSLLPFLDERGWRLRTAPAGFRREVSGDLCCVPVTREGEGGIGSADLAGGPTKGVRFAAELACVTPAETKRCNTLHLCQDGEP